MKSIRCNDDCGWAAVPAALIVTIVASEVKRGSTLADKTHHSGLDFFNSPALDW